METMKQWQPNEKIINGTNFSFDMSSEQGEVSHKVLSSDMELSLVFLYSFIGMSGLVSNIALIAIILGKFYSSSSISEKEKFELHFSSF